MFYSPTLEKTSLKDLFICLSASIILGLFAYVRMDLFFTPVPIILQNSLAISYGLFLGKRNGSISVLLFILFGLIGFPFFAGGHSGISMLATPSFGYILAYFISANFLGHIFTKMKNKTTAKVAIATLTAHMIVLIIGSLWLAQYVGLKKCFLLGFLPFIPFDIIKTIAIVKLYSRSSR